MVEDTYYWEEQQMSSLNDYIKYIGELEGDLADVLLENFQSASFINWLEELGYRELYDSWYNYYYQESGIYKDEDWVGHALGFLEKVSEENRSRVSIIYINYIKRQPEFWIKEHIDLYNMDESMEHMLVDPLDALSFLPQMSIEELLTNHKQLCNLYSELKRGFMNNPWLYKLNLYEVSQYRITSAYADAYLVTSSKYQNVPIGWIKSINKDYNSERLNLSAVEMREQAVKTLSSLKQQVSFWQKDMRETRQQYIQSKNVPNGKVALVVTIISALMILYCIMGFIRVGNWSYGVLLRIIYVASLALSGICLFQFLQQLIFYSNWKKIRDCFSSTTIFVNQLDQLIAELKEPVDFDNNLLLEKELIESEKENGIVDIQVKQATFKQLVQQKKIKKGKKIYLLMLLVAMVLSIGITTLMHSSEEGQQSSNVISTEEGQSNQGTIYTVSVKRANVRTGPGTSYEVYNTYSKGEQFEGTGKSESDGSRMWYEIKVENGETAWICETTVE